METSDEYIKRQQDDANKSLAKPEEESLTNRSVAATVGKKKETEKTLEQKKKGTEETLEQRKKRMYEKKIIKNKMELERNDQLFQSP